MKIKTEVVTKEQLEVDITPEEALQEMKDHNQDTTAVEKAIAMANKQKGK